MKLEPFNSIKSHLYQRGITVGIRISKYLKKKKNLNKEKYYLRNLNFCKVFFFHMYAKKKI